jgi:CDGSH-type Zn-finger protein
MEDATKALAKLLYGTGSDPDTSQDGFNEAKGTPAGFESLPLPAEPEETTKEKAIDRWFREQRGNKRVPKRLDIPNEVLVTSGGPLKMTGNITLIEEDGTITHTTNLSLCRCGASNSTPLCDDQHLEIEFLDNGSIGKASDWSPISRPQTVTVKVIPDGPLKFRGYLKVFNRKGQECISMSGALCRCGRSTKKPFCDCQ